MNKKWLFIIGKRFVKSFISGGLAGLTLTLAQNPNPVISNLAELKTWAIVFAYAFIVGGIMALQKAWQGYSPR